MGDTLVYAWDLDADGAFDDSTAVQPTFTYTVAGTYNARLRVTDNHGASDVSDPVVITAGSPTNAPPVARIDAPQPTLTWRVERCHQLCGFGNRSTTRHTAGVRTVVVADLASLPVDLSYTSSADVRRCGERLVQRSGPRLSISSRAAANRD